ncbi:MAG TPA: plastocyanin/azurin family copper-binding protein [Gaiellaceae bacterium]|nr:plastocyanin/azurin family copper-binding protein [Gaiellaceae bacterium]
MKRIVSLAVAAAAAATVFAVVAYAGHTASTATSVKVTAKDFKFTLSRKSAPHGKVVFHVTNKGPSKHDFKIAGKKTKLLGKGKSATLSVTLKKGKKYTYICTVPGHAALGMKGIFKAT